MKSDKLSNLCHGDLIKTGVGLQLYKTIKVKSKNKYKCLTLFDVYIVEDMVICDIQTGFSCTYDAYGRYLREILYYI